MKLPSNNYRSFLYKIKFSWAEGGGIEEGRAAGPRTPHDTKLSCRTHISVIERIRCPPDPILRGKFDVPQRAAAAGGGGGSSGYCRLVVGFLRSTSTFKMRRTILF